jgi:glycosyltransferase involved in cell wall biosynthesis
MYLTVVLPVFNEEGSIEATIHRILNTIRPLNWAFEILIVNDGSSDSTMLIAETLRREFESIEIVNLARNSGHMAAITAGLDLAKGRWVVTIDGDGQDPPELIPQMISHAEENAADICFMVRRDRRQDSLRHRIFSPFFYRALSRATSGKAPIQAADYRLMSDRVISVLRKLPETNRVYRVITPALGFKSVEIEYSRNHRTSGESKYRFFKLAVLAMRSLIATSGAPLRWLSNLSVAIAGISLLYSIFVLMSGVLGSGPPGWASLSLLLSLILFVQALAMAVICEFLLSILADVRNRPLYQLKDDRFGH